MKETDIASIFKHIYTVFRVHGVNNVMDKLRQLQQVGLNEYNLALMEFIVTEVANMYRVRRSDLRTVRGGPESEARKMCYVIMCQELTVSEKNVAWYFDRSPKVVYRALEEYREMSDKVNWQKDFLKKLAVLRVKLDKRKQEVLKKA
jgi:hypothetical protein